MIVKTIVDDVYHTNNHLVIDGKGAVLIDASAPLNDIINCLNGIPLKAVLLTHSHFDHIVELEKIINHFDCPVYIHKNGYQSLFDSKLNLSQEFNVPMKLPKISNIKTISDNEVLNYLSAPIKVIHTPGHSNCSVCYEIGDYLFTGDTLFSACVGRCDFWHSNANEQQQSLVRLSKLPDKAMYYAGHGNTFNARRAGLVINKYTIK